MECVRQDEGDGGKLWDAMRRTGSCGRRRKAVSTFLHTKGDTIRENRELNCILKTVAVKAKADSCGEQKRKGFQAREKCVSCPIYEGKAYDESPPWGAAAGVESKSGIQAYHTPHETSDS